MGQAAAAIDYFPSFPPHQAQEIINYIEAVKPERIAAFKALVKDELTAELVTKDFLKAELATFHVEIKAEISAMRTGIDEKIERVEQRVGQVEQGIERVEQSVGQVEQGIERVEQRVGQIEQKVGRVEQRVGQVEQRIGQVEKEMGQMEARLTARISDNTRNLLLWMIGLQVGSLFSLLGLVKFFLLS